MSTNAILPCYVLSVAWAVVSFCLRLWKLISATRLGYHLISAPPVSASSWKTAFSHLLALLGTSVLDAKSLNTVTMPPTISSNGGSADYQPQHKDTEILSGNTVRKQQRKGLSPRLLVALVGLPASGKSYTAHRLARYLYWNNFSAKVFGVADYRRKCKHHQESRSSLCAEKSEDVEHQTKYALEALGDAAEWMKDGQIAILDSTNCTRSERHFIHEMFGTKLGYQVLFVQLTCDDTELIKTFTKMAKEGSSDYKEMSAEKAEIEFTLHLEHHRKRFEPLHSNKDKHLTFINIHNAGETVLSHGLKGHWQSQILGFLSVFRPVAKVFYLTRHGESEFNASGRIGGDANLSQRGMQYAGAMSRYINDTVAPHAPNLTVWTSALRRTAQTAASIRAPKIRREELNEIDAGVCEGLTYEEIQERYPTEFAWRDQDKLRYSYPWGESYLDVAKRVEPVLFDLENEGNVVVVSHQAVLRCVLGYFSTNKYDELPYINIPLHTILKVSVNGNGCHVEYIKIPVACVDTFREKPKNCDSTRTPEDALVTVPEHD